MDQQSILDQGFLNDVLSLHSYARVEVLGLGGGMHFSSVLFYICIGHPDWFQIDLWFSSYVCVSFRCMPNCEALLNL